MNLIDPKAFLESEPTRLGAYALQKAAAANLTIAPAFRAGVVDNIIALQSHALILRNYVEGSEPQASRFTSP